MHIHFLTVKEAISAPEDDVTTHKDHIDIIFRFMNVFLTVIGHDG